MAGDWIPFAHETLKKPEVYGIANRLNLSRRETLGMLLELWVWGDENAIDGHARSVTKKNIDRDIGVTGFADAVEAEGWLEVKNGGIFFPNWERHMGKSAKNRLLAAHRQRAHRAKSNAVVTEMSRSQRNKSVTTEQKRTEQNKKKTPQTPQGADVDFDEFWAAWPSHSRKASKGKCLEKWRKDGLAKRAEHIVAVVEAKKRTPQWQEDGGKYIPAPLVFLNQRRWDCDLEDLKHGAAEGHRQFGKGQVGHARNDGFDEGIRIDA